ncbi:MAG: bifunctional diaminohydroxyphosphoribosylaminopyrimidine deaminase/5-amino-6-(5-phosphoribosylamino)uracil reductase RibD [Betaproteobacteria bacterium]|nr:bifunctional diaminohydroxyphosphoribosylaminopyrimidine deaminase/5-amino-6-(5-phosphoribosylamino)uracil reductase RibD [Betaproteobacteria bacterium]
MARALRLAERGLNTTMPNPRVGCVLVRAGAVVGEGWHERAGEAHAEIAALRAAGEAARGAVAYVTLEPCCHHGRTPPCADALIDAGVARVVAAMKDPNPLVSGAGLAKLQAAGIVAEAGVLEEKARELNIGFVSRMQRGRPWVRLKIATTLDGKTALSNGASQWITGPEARADGHAWRARACAILTGIGTVRADDPRLTVRDVTASRQPLRIVVDSRMTIGPQANVLAGGGALVVAAHQDTAKAATLRAAGSETLVIPGADGQVDLAALMAELGTRAINEIHVEAGPILNGALLRERLADEILLYFAPSLLGDRARGMFDLPELNSLGERHALDLRDVRRIGADLRILARMLDSR